MSRTAPIILSGLLALTGIAVTLVELPGSIDAGVGAGIAALMFIALAATALLA